MGIIVFLLVVAVVGLLVTVVRLSTRVDLLTTDQRHVSDRVDALSQRGGPAPARPLAVTPPPIVAPPPRAASMPASMPEAQDEPAPAVPAESWEMVVGTNWLNKIGVFVFVIGIALLVSYSFSRVGPGGRIVIGYLASASLLGAGLLLEPRAAFRRYAYGLIAGGWAGVYFTTFAMHGVPAARVLDNAWIASGLLLLVAAGMIAHSVRYRSQVVTGLAFLVAYATLALSPLTGFALAASIPLVLALLVVSQRFGWPHLSALGIVATYAVYAIRGSSFADSAVDPHSVVPYLTLAAYWLTFEVCDLATSRQPKTSMVWLNAVGLTFALLLTLPIDHPRYWSVSLFTAGLAYLVSAIVRRRLPATGTTTPEAFDTSHAAIAIAAALFVGAITREFSGHRESLALLLLAQLLFATGITLGDRYIGRIAALVAASAALHIWSLGLAWDDWQVVAFAAVVFHANHEVLYRRTLASDRFAPVYSWIGTALASTAIHVGLVPAQQALAGLALSVLLLEAGFRRGAHLAWQAYATGLGWAYALILAFVLPVTARGTIGAGWGPAPTPADEWIVLPAAIALAAYAAWRLSKAGAAHPPLPQAPLASACAGAIALALLVLFEWRVVPSRGLTAAWAASGLILVIGGLFLRGRQLRLSGLALLAACLLKLFLVDASALDAVARILSFVALGAILLAISWTYTRYREHIRRYL